MIYRLVATMFALSMASALPAVAQSIPYVKSPEKTFRLAHGLTLGSPYDLGARRFAELVEVYSHGSLKVDVYPSAQLGKEQDTAKDVQLGTLDMALVPTNNSSMWYPPLDALNMPFIFTDREHVNKVVNGPIGEDLFEKYRKASGIKIVSVMEWGDRAIMNSVRPVNTPGDLRGIKLRLPKNRVMIETYLALGATPAAIDWGDLYGALQQKVADGLEGPPQGMLDMKFTDFLKYYSYVHPFHGISLILFNDKTYRSLSAAQRDVIDRAGFEAGEYQRWVSAKSHVGGLKRLTDAGVKVNVVQDVRPFVDAVKPVWAKYKPIVGEALFDQIRNASK